jgi:hypothetical protein
MNAHHVRLVLPAGLHNTYTLEQAGELIDLQEFIDVVRERQSLE